MPCSRLARGRGLPTDEGASYDHELALDASALEPMITFGNNPGMGMPITGTVPDPAGVAATMFRTLAAKSNNIQVISTSEIKVSVLIGADYTELAVRALHTAYGLDA